MPDTPSQVTLRGGVLPPPAFPPLPGFAPLPAPGVQAPGPDVKAMIPDASERVVILNKIEDPEKVFPVPFREAQVAVNEPRNWRLLDLFHHPTNPGLAPRNYPQSDPFTVYLMATLARFAYGGSGRFWAVAKDALTAAMEGWVLEEVTSPSNPFIGYHLWRQDSGAKVIVFKGSTKLTEWLSYTVPTLVPITGFGTTSGGYAGIVAIGNQFTSLITADATGVGPNSGPVILVGHSLGGALAQYLGGVANVAFKAAYPAGTMFPVRAQYTFGAPAWLSDTVSDSRIGTLDLMCRVYLEGDPVPHATQLYMSQAAGILPAIDLLRPGFPKLAKGTRHYANKEIPLVRMPIGDATLYQTAALRALVLGGNKLLAAMIDQHSIRSYCMAAAELAKRPKSSPPGPLAAVGLANNAMDLADAGVQT